jgi:hypothetical protein
VHLRIRRPVGIQRFGRERKRGNENGEGRIYFEARRY